MNSNDPIPLSPEDPNAAAVIVARADDTLPGTPPNTPFVLKPLSHKHAPLAPAETVVAVNTVLLAAGDIPAGILRRFYERVLGLDHVASDEPDTLRFKHLRREILVSRQTQRLGTVKLTIRNVNEILPKLRDAHLHYELLHPDDGLTTTILLRDPAGNLVYLHQTRPF
jgi:hypothetical protein